MGLLFRRRRPLLRAAMLAGTGAVAYQAGRRRQTADDRDYDQDRQIADLRDGAAYPAAPAAPAAPAPDPAGSGTVAELERLKALLDQGALTREEFESAKRRVLAGD